jgi:hypothetical protein
MVGGLVPPSTFFFYGGTYMSHDVFNASSTATWIECSYSALNAVPDPPKKESTQAAADEGTRRHSSLDGVVFFGELPPSDAPEYDQIVMAKNFLDQLEPGEMHSELRVKIADNCGGTTDVFNKHSHVATIFDAKFGKWDVDAFHNKQMLTYGAALLPVCDAEWWRLVIFQPNGLDEEPFKQWVAHRSEVEAHRNRVLRAIADRSAPRPGPWCRWCNAFQQCPAMATDAGFVMGAISRPPESLAPDELVRLLRLIRALGDVKEAYEDVLTVKLKLGYTAPGAALKPGRSFRSWNDATQAAEYLHQHYGPKGVKPLSPAQAEKLGPAGKQYAVVGAHKPEAPLKVAY